MLAISFIIFRELIEISLLLNIIIITFKNYNNKILGISLGSVIGIICSVIFGLLITEISDLFEGKGQELFEICILFLSIGLIFITINWIQKDLIIKVPSTNAASKAQILFTMSLITSAIILREGIEIFLFIYGVVISKEITSYQLISNIIYAIILSIPFNIALYFSLTKISYKYLFSITNWFLTFLAAAMSSKIADLLISIDFINFGTEQLWDSSNIISNNSTSGKILKNFIGYDAQPSVLKVIFYLLTIGVIHIRKIYYFLKKT